MKALTITKFGGPQVLQFLEREDEALPKDSVRIRVAAAGVNFADLLMRQGLYPEAPPLPFVPGYEVSGTVEEVGSAVTKLKKGDRVVAGTRFGGYAEEAVIPAGNVRKIPAKLDFVQAAAIPVNFMTAWVALHEMGRVRKGDRVLVQSGAGGVGTAAIQLARQAGAEVVAIVGSDSKKEACRQLGAARAELNDWWYGSDEKTTGKFDIVLDSMGGASLKHSMNRLKLTGRTVSFGVSSMISGQKRSFLKMIQFVLKTPFFHPLGGALSNKGFYGMNMLQLFDLPADAIDNPINAAFDGVLDAFDRGELKTVIGKTFPLDQGGQAQEYLRSRANVGKVILTV